jgi:hypothetical protein
LPELLAGNNAYSHIEPADRQIINDPFIFAREKVDKVTGPKSPQTYKPVIA